MAAKIHLLNGVVQPYTWGGQAFIPDLVGIDNVQKLPFAEYWLGAHPNFPSLIEKSQLLNDYIRSNPKNILGEKVTVAFGELPFLFKVLDVRSMLSIQVHPSIASARLGFKNEQGRGIPINSTTRNYKDQNHKPELMVALSDFYLLHGFKPEPALLAILESVKEFGSFIQIFKSSGYKGLYQHVMKLDQGKVNEILKPLVQRLLPSYHNHKLQKTEEGFWAARAALHFCKQENYDRGIFSIYFFNLLHLKKGQGIYQPAGLPHAYLEGQNLEVMANSDNVLRAGLTDKHIDVEELMKHVIFTATTPEVLDFPQNLRHKIFTSPAQEFELHQYELSTGEKCPIEATTAEIWLLMKGRVSLKTSDQEVFIQKGQAVFLEVKTAIIVESSVDSTLFRVTVPDE
ncbi:MAG: mannose-6-phosphate isomerase [Flavisolibacter sp.]